MFVRVFFKIDASTCPEYTFFMLVECYGWTRNVNFDQEIRVFFGGGPPTFLVSVFVFGARST